ncbi:hypothetical protein B0O79_0778 [Flavobacteriaceae bacterium MAR_2009_75]|nr:hypothetical protein B0O79_0778 [Flavobacteriaceae bacterium MAR_2009_75]
MMTFFTILLVLIGANAIFMVFSLSGVSNGGKKDQEDLANSESSKIYPLQSNSSKLKKAV